MFHLVTFMNNSSSKRNFNATIGLLLIKLRASLAVFAPTEFRSHADTNKRIYLIILFFPGVFLIGSRSMGAQVSNDFLSIHQQPNSQLHSQYELFQFAVRDLVQSGVQGEIYSLEFSKSLKQTQSQMNFRTYEGPFFAIKALPQTISSKAQSTFLRTPAILDQLNKLLQNDVRLIFITPDRGIDAVVFNKSDPLNNGIREALEVNDSTQILAISPTMTFDILVHEMEHIAQAKSSHRIQKTLAEIRPALNDQTFRKTRKTLEEIMSYRAQMQYLSTLEKQPPQVIGIAMFQTGSNFFHFEEIPFSTYRLDRRFETRVTIDMQLTELSRQLRESKIDNHVSCKIHQALMTELQSLEPVIDLEQVQIALFGFNCP